MGYPKKFMSISELHEMGLNKEILKQWVHIKGFPCFRRSKAKRSKYYIDTDKLDKWLEGRNIAV